ncbi:MAG: oligosaccharide flippase family protein [Atribacterota bacterium]
MDNKINNNSKNNNISSMASIPKRIFRGSSAVFAGKTGVYLAGFIFTPVLVRLIGKEGYGIYGTLISVYYIVKTISILGLQDSIRKHIAQYGNKKGSSNEIASFSIILAIILGILIALVGGLIIFVLYKIGTFELKTFNYLLILLTVLIINNSLEAFVSTLYGIYKEGKVSTLRILQKLAFYFLAIAFVLLDFWIIGVLLGLLIAEIITTFSSYLFVKKHIKVSFYSAKIGFQQYGKKIVSFGVFTLIGIFSATLLMQVDILIVQNFEGNAITGAYKAAHIAAEMILFIPPILQLVMLTNCTELWHQNRKQELIDISSKIWKYNFLILSLLSIGLVVLAKPFVNFYFGEGFNETTILLILLIPGCFFFGLSRIINPIIVGSGWVIHSTILAVFVATLNIGLNFMLVPRYGAIGAAIGTSISYFLFFIFYLVLLKLRRLNLLKELLLGRFTLLIIVFGGLFYYINLIWPFSDISKLFVTPIIGIILFVLLANSFSILYLKELKIRVKQIINAF